MIEHFGKLVGVPYPWNKYAQIVVSDFIFGGMENTTATTMYEHLLLDERAALDVTSDDLIAHELAHQWFGDYVTCRDWSHGWLNEGFATFFEHIDLEHKLGKDEYQYALRGDLDAYFAEANGRYRRPIVCQDYEAPIDIFDRHLYQKGGLVLHMLRTALGDDVFWSSVRAYLKKHARSIVETRDLMRALEEVSGRGLEQFFEQWVYRPGHPELEVKVEHEGGVLNIGVKQTQKVDKEAPCFRFHARLRRGPRKGQSGEAHPPRRKAGGDHRAPLPRTPELRGHRSRLRGRSPTSSSRRPSTCSSASSPMRRPLEVAGSRPSRSANEATRPRSTRLARARARDGVLGCSLGGGARPRTHAPRRSFRDLEDQGQDQAPQSASRGRSGARAIFARPKPPRR